MTIDSGCMAGDSILSVSMKSAFRMNALWSSTTGKIFSEIAMCCLSTASSVRGSVVSKVGGSSHTRCVVLLRAYMYIESGCHPAQRCAGRLNGPVSIVEEWSIEAWTSYSTQEDCFFL